MKTMEERVKDLELCLEVLIDQRREEASEQNQPGVAATQLQIEATKRAIEDERGRPDPVTEEDRQKAQMRLSLSRRKPSGFI